MQKFLEWAAPGSREFRLAQQLDPAKLPGHIAVIMDGNGRWAKRRALPRVAGHRAGVKSVREIIEACCRLDIEALTLYAFSMENWKRPKAEIETLWRLLSHYLHVELPDLKANNVRFQTIGRIEALPQKTRDDIDYAIAIEETEGFSGAEIEAVLLAAASNASDDGSEVIQQPHLDQAARDIIPSRDTRMLDYMEMLAVFECSAKRMLPDRFQELETDEVQERIDELRNQLGRRAL